MRILIGAIITVAMLASCKAAPLADQTDTAIPPRATTAAQAKLEPGDPMSPLDKDGSKKSPFTQEVALRLNDIMRRTKAIIDDFDKKIPEIRKAVETAKGKAPNSPESLAADQAIANLKTMHSGAKSALVELDKEGAALIASKQYYSEPTFSGMALFATKVEKELNDEIKLLTSDKK